MSDYPHTPHTADTADLVRRRLPWLYAIWDFPDIAAAINEIERLSAIVAAVDALHRQVPATPYAHSYCDQCDHLWPCSTHLAIHPEDNR